MDSEMVSMTSSTYVENGSNGVSAATLHSDHFVSPRIDMKVFRLRKKSRAKCWIIETVEENEEEETSRGLGMEASHGNEKDSVSFSIDETAQLNSPEKLGGESVSCEAYCSGRSSNGYCGFGTAVAV
eukprot:Gb_01608 [translate_table: standard]